MKNYAIQCKSMQIRSRDLETAIVLEKKIETIKEVNTIHVIGWTTKHVCSGFVE